MIQDRIQDDDTRSYKMKLVKIYFIILVLSVAESCYGQMELYLNHKILTTPLVCESESKCIVLNNGAIDSIVTRSKMELNLESAFTFVYLHSGKSIDIAGECVYYSKESDSPFCVLESPCCAGNTFEYHWMQYDALQDTIKQVFEIVVFTTTDIRRKDIIWHKSPKRNEIQHVQLRSEPLVNDTDEDYELRQVGNIIYSDIPSDTAVIELGYIEKQSEWRLCAVQMMKNRFRIGWKQAENIQSKL